MNAACKSIPALCNVLYSGNGFIDLFTNYLHDFSGTGTTRELTIPIKVFNELSDEEIDIAENKEAQSVVEKDPIDVGLSVKSKSTTPVTTKNDVKKSLSSF